MSFADLRFTCHHNNQAFDSEQALKEWLWKAHASEIFAAMRLDLLRKQPDSDSGTAATHAESEPESSRRCSWVSRVSSVSGKKEEAEPASSESNGATLVSSGVPCLLVNKLEAEIAEKMEQLQIANAKLSKANRVVMQESQRQLEHFACTFIVWLAAFVSQHPPSLSAPFVY